MLETQIQKQLWNSVRKNYEIRNFSEAIIDAIYYLSNLIRDKTGLESDGAALVGQAFGGTQPQIKVNSLQTESEQNVQKGLEQILRGLYQAIRNPRSHDRYEDSQLDADAIIQFIDFITRIIDKSKTQFSEIDFYTRVFDRNFVESDRYAELLVSEIPKRKRLNIAIEVYKKKETGDGNKLYYFFKSLLQLFNDEEISDFYEIVSNELQTISNFVTLKYILQILPFEYWHKIKELSRIRVEHMLMDSINEDKTLVDETRQGGELGTWVSGNIKYMTFKEDFITICLNKLNSYSEPQIEYITDFFWDDIIHNIGEDRSRFNLIVKSKLKEGNENVYFKLYDHFILHPIDPELDIFKEEFENFGKKEFVNDMPF